MQDRRSTPTRDGGERISEELDVPRGVVSFDPRRVEVHFDGACEPARGGGVAAWGFTVEGGGLDHEDCGLAVRPFSPHATNNVAEYVAAIRALEWLSGTGYRGSVAAFGDSQLVVRQMNGQYRVKSEHLKAYHERLLQLAKEFPRVEFAWVPREKNARADALSKRALEEATPEAERHRPAEPVEPAHEDESVSGDGSAGGPER